MGQSTNAELVYGVMLEEYDECYYEDLPFANDEDEDFEDFVCRRAGAPNYGAEGFTDAVWELRNKASGAYPVDLYRHCSGDCPMWILGLKATHMLAYRGGPVSFDALPPVPDTHELELMCQQFGIPYEPSWLLYSDWN